MKAYRNVITIGVLAGLAVLGGILFYGCGPPPQLGADEEVFRTVDALYTAITARNEKLLGDCENRLQAHKQTGKLPERAAAQLEDIIATARQGRWQRAAERLYGFMSGQRREGAPKRK